MGSSSSRPASSARRSSTSSYPAARNRLPAPGAPSQQNGALASPRRATAPPGSGVPRGAAPPPAPAPPPATTLSRPGAYSVSRDGAGPSQVFRVQIPREVRPGQEFQVIAGSQTVRCRCPAQSRGGQYLQISVPADPVVRHNTQGMAVLTSATGHEGGGAVLMEERVRETNAEVLQEQEQERRQEPRPPSGPRTAAPATPPPPSPVPQGPPQTYMVTVPPGVTPGMQFAVEVEGTRMMVTCPSNVQAGMNLRILPPQQPPTQSSPPNLHGGAGTALEHAPEHQISASAPPSRPPAMQMFEVVVPSGVMPGQSFSLLANGQRVLVTCPLNIRSGQKVRFQLPISNPEQGDEDAKTVKLEYESKDGWTRTIRVTDMKFQWVRMNDDGNLKSVSRFDIHKSAFTRQLVFLEGNDPRMRTGTLSFGQATLSSTDSSVRVDGKDVVTYAEIAQGARGSFDQKASWFQEICRERLRVNWDEGHIRVLVRSEHLLHDSIEAVMSLSRKDLRKTWRFEFLGKQAIDAGGLAREWFQLVTEELFNPNMGLWLPSASNQMAMRINPASSMACPEDHLIYFRFLGRVMGKALFDGQLVSGHMVRHVYKHILDWPIMFADLELPDEEYYNSLKSLLVVENVEDLCLDFTFTENALGENRVVQLVEGGEGINVTNENLPEFLECNLNYHMMDRVKPQLTELLLGFYDVLPESLLTIFDFHQLELLMCGLPEIDIEDWRSNTIYSGQFLQKKEQAQTCQWFWEVIRDDFDQETRARLLQFVTGTSGVPSGGFSVLQGNDGNLKKFTLHGITKEQSYYPRSHTCFNRIDMPIYSSKEELSERLSVAVTTSATGFDTE